MNYANKVKKPLYVKDNAIVTVVKRCRAEEKEGKEK